MKTRFQQLFILTLVLGVTLISCDEGGNGSVTISADTVMDIPADVESIISTSGPVANIPGDTSNTGGYTFFDLDNNVIVTDSLSSSWDIGFSRTNIIANTGNGGGIQVTEQDYNDSNVAPESGYVEGTSESSASWYNYNAQAFTIEVLDNRTIFVNTPDGNYAKVDILSYYNTENEEARFFTFNFTLQTNGTTSLSNIVYYDLDTNEIVQDQSSSQWDIGFGATTIFANAGNNGGILPFNNTYDQVIAAPTSGYQTQNSSWYNYTAGDTPVNAILPKGNLTLILKNPDGNYAKVRILSYYKGNPDVTSDEFINVSTRPSSRYYTFEYTLTSNGSTSFE